MPSPFQGMDHDLEGELWTNFHTQFAVEIARTLNPPLAPRHVAITEKYHEAVGTEEIAIAGRTDVMTPDVRVSQASSRPLPARATAVTEPPLKMETVISIPLAHV